MNLLLKVKYIDLYIRTINHHVCKKRCFLNFAYTWIMSTKIDIVYIKRYSILMQLCNLFLK